MKKHFILLFVAVLTFFVFSPHSTNAQEKRLNSSPKDFQTFFLKFKAAVEKSDKNGVASMTVFPFRYGFDAGDEGTMTRTQFIRAFNRIFGRNPKQFFTESNPRFSRGDDGSYVISTEDASHLIFVKSGNSFKFSAYIVEP